MSKNKIIILSILLTLFLVSSSHSQIIYGQPGFGNPQFIYTHWSIDNKNELLGEIKISQTVIPFVGFIPLKDNLEMHVFVASTNNTMEYASNELSFSGLSDLKIQLNQSLKDDRFLLSASFNLPTGKKKLNLSTETDSVITEWYILETLARDFLDFPIRRLGGGVGFNLLAGAATTVNDIRLGGGIAYNYKGTYEPYAGADDYNPGDVFKINAGGDLQKGSLLWSLNLAYTTYTADLMDGQKSFKQSPHFNIALGAVYKKKNITFGNHINYLSRGKNIVYDSTEIVLSKLQMFGDELSFNSYFNWQHMTGWYLTPTVSYRKISDNELNLGSAKLFSFGINTGKPIKEKYEINTGFKIYTGSAYGGDIDLSGYQFTISITAVF